MDVSPFSSPDSSLEEEDELVPGTSREDRPVSQGSVGDSDQGAVGSSSSEELQLKELDWQPAELGQRESQIQQVNLEAPGGE